MFQLQNVINYKNVVPTKARKNQTNKMFDLTKDVTYKLQQEMSKRYRYIKVINI